MKPAQAKKSSRAKSTRRLQRPQAVLRLRLLRRAARHARQPPVRAPPRRVHRRHRQLSGILRANDGGTLLLDEIGEVSLDQQVKLLRFLETGEVHPLGETKPVKVDVRVIAATNRPLEKLIAEGRFREDLYYRLNVVRFLVPPLRERREEILPFFEHFLTRECSNAARPVPPLSDAAVEHLLLYRWPGNVRQLYNEVRRILSVLPVGQDITPEGLAQKSSRNDGRPSLRR